MKKNIYRLIIFIVIILVAGWQLYTKYDKANISNFKFSKDYQEVQAIVKRVTPSGVRTKRTTILFVEYMQNDIKKTSTFRRDGFQEGNYNVGDTILIYINTQNQNDIK